MSLIVVDASAMASWLLPGQATPAATTLLLRLEDHDVLAPALFPVEVRALILKAERRGWLSARRIVQALDWYRGLQVEVHPMPDSDAMDAIFEFARPHRLGFYDAVYLDLALQTGAELATRDSSLIAAARTVGVEARDLRPVAGFHEP